MMSPTILVSLSLQATTLWSLALLAGDFKNTEDTKKCLEQHKQSLEMLQVYYQGAPQPDVATTLYSIEEKKRHWHLTSTWHL